MQHNSINAVETLNGNVAALVTRDLNFNTTGTASGVKQFTLRADAVNPVLIEIWVEVVTAFNAATNIVTAGTTAGSSNLIGASDVTAGTVGFYPPANASVKKRIVADTDIYLKYAQSGTAATTGKAKFYLRITPLAPDPSLVNGLA